MTAIPSFALVRSRCSLVPSCHSLTVRRSYTHRRPRPIASSVGSWSILVAAFLGTTGGALYCLAYRTQEPQITQTYTNPHSPKIPTMVAPGRPGNLTPEQEAGLRELWRLTLRVFGVVQDSYSAPDTASTNSSDTPADTKDAKKKSRLGFLGRRKEGKKGDAASTDASIALAGGDQSNDKYGQTKEFKQALADTAPEDLRQAFWDMVKHDDPDALLLRFLRARKWDVQAALVMMISTMRWRMVDVHVDDDIMFNGEGTAAKQAANDADPAAQKEGKDFLTQIRMGKAVLHGIDAEGRPTCFVRVRLHRQGEQSESSLERQTVYIIETARLLLQDGTDTATIVFDMTDFSLANMDYAPVKFMIKCFEANYPESLGAVLVHRAPWVFQGIWSIIRGWLDPVVAGKVHFTKNADELAGFIPRERLPKEVGGDEDWQHAFPEPVPGENQQMEDAAARDAIQDARTDMVRKYEEATLAWIGQSGTDGEATDIALQKQRRNELAEQLRVNYWRLDPYVRARSYVDRLGILGSGGALNFYPDSQGKKPIETAPATADDDVD